MEERILINRSSELLQIARDFIKDKDLICAYVGGSVGRGEADQYSDIDLTVFTLTEVASKKADILYKGEIIQLETLHISELPNQDMIEVTPWDFRFLVEVTILKDEEGKLNELIKWATDYFHSDHGRKKMIEQVSHIVRERIESAFDCLKQQKYYSATIAAMGAWAKAGFLYLFCKEHSLANELMIPRMQSLEVYHTFKRVSPFNLDVNVLEVQRIISRFRKHLRNKGYSYNDVFEIHDILCERKIQRLSNKKEYLNLRYQMYGEALWLYFETSEGLSFEQYFNQLPNELQNDLSKIGFIALEEKNVKEICELGEELLKLSY